MPFKINTCDNNFKKYQEIQDKIWRKRINIWGQEIEDPLSFI